MGAPYDLVPATVVSAGSWGVVGAATIPAALDDPWDSPNDDTDYAQGSNVAWDSLIFTWTPMIDTVAINGVTMKARFNNAGGGSSQMFDFGIRIGGVNYLNGPVAVPSAVYAELTKFWALNPATGGPWTKPQPSCWKRTPRPTP